MLHPRNLLILAGLLLLIFGGWMAWRKAHPPLTDEQQIAANVEAVRQAIEARNARRIVAYLADDFTWNGAKKNEIESQLTGGFWQARDITANVAGLQITQNGDTATSTGNFSLTLRPSPHSRADAYTGKFTLHWKKRDGQWLVTKLEGGENVGG